MVHWVVTTGLLWNVIVMEEEGTSHSVLLLVALPAGDTTGEVIVVVKDDLVVLDAPDSLLVEVVEYVIVEEALRSG